TAHVHGHLLAQIAVGHGCGHLGNVADLAGKVSCHGVHVVGEVLPHAGDAANLGLAADPAFGADFKGHAGDLGGKGIELVHHGVDRVLELEDFATHIHRHLFSEVAVSNSGRHVRDVPDLAGQVASHGVDVVGQVLPDTGDAPD